MNDCERFEETIRAHVAGEPVADDGGALALHAERCAGCRALLELHGTLVEIGERVEDDGPDPARFAAMRADVLRRVRGRAGDGSTGADDVPAGTPRPIPRSVREEPGAAGSGAESTQADAGATRIGAGLSWDTAGAERRGSHRPRHVGAQPSQVTLRPFAAVAAAVLLFVTGYAAARLGFDSTFPGGPGPQGEPLLAEISSEAASNRSLGDVEDSPFIYSNVTLRGLADGRVALDFDVARHVSTVEAAGSPLVQDVLAQALLNPSHTGSRLKAIGLAAGTMSPKVRDALIFALHHDDNLAVRLKALSILGQRPGGPDPAVEAAVLVTLRQDESVQMRLNALDILAERRLDPEAIRRAIDLDDPSDDPSAAALMVRLGEYERSSRSGSR